MPVVDKYVDLDWAHLHDNANNLREYFWSARLLEWAPIAGTVAVARRSPPLAALLATWFGVFLVVKGTTVLSTVSSGSFFRFLMPGIPGVLPARGLDPVARPDARRVASRRVGRQRPPSPLGRRLVIGLGVCSRVVPLVVVALVRPIETPAKAIAVDDDRHARRRARSTSSVEADGEARIVTWSHPPAGSSDVFYRVYRTGLNGLDAEVRSTTAAPRSARSEDGPARDDARAALAGRIAAAGLALPDRRGGELAQRPHGGRRRDAQRAGRVALALRSRSGRMRCSSSASRCARITFWSASFEITVE